MLPGVTWVIWYEVKFNHSCLKWTSVTSSRTGHLWFLPGITVHLGHSSFSVVHYPTLLIASSFCLVSMFLEMKDLFLIFHRSFYIVNRVVRLVSKCGYTYRCSRVHVRVCVCVFPLNQLRKYLSNRFNKFQGSMESICVTFNLFTIFWTNWERKNGRRGYHVQNS